MALLKNLAVIAVGCLFAADAAAAAKNDCLKNADARAQINACGKAIKSARRADKQTLALYHLARAGAYIKTEQNNPASDDIDAALELDPANPDVYMKRGWLFNRTGEYNKAVKNLLLALNMDKEAIISGWAYYQLAIAYAMQDNSSVSAKQLAAGRELSPELYPAYVKEFAPYKSRLEERRGQIQESLNSGKLYISEGRFDESAVAFRRLIEYSPDQPEYHSWLGSVYYDLGKYSEALSELRHPPQEDQWNYYIALSLLKLGKVDEAAAAFKMAASDAPPRNRGEPAKDISKYLSAIIDYKKSMSAAADAAAKKRNIDALRFAEVALRQLETKEALDLVQEQKSIVDKRAVARKKSFYRFLFTLILGLAAASIIKLLANWKRDSSAKSVYNGTELVNSLVTQTPRDAYMGFMAYKKEHKKDALWMAEMLIEKIALSRDGELINAFAQEIPPARLNEYWALAASAMANATGGQGGIDALVFLNRIPFPAWTKRELDIFCQAHLACDDVLLNSDNPAFQAIWQEGIPIAAYTALAENYSARKEFAKAIQAFEKYPSYLWEDAQWFVFLKLKAELNQFNTVDLMKLPASIQPYAVEEMFRRGHLDVIRKFLGEESKVKWRPEYYFYAFVCAAGNFDDAWAVYSDYSRAFGAAAGSQAGYMMAVYCEKLGRFENAMEIYGKLLSAGANIKDSAARYEFIRSGQAAGLSPKAAEILAPILPAGA